MSYLLGLSEPWGYLLIALLAAAEGAALIGLFLPGEAAMLLGGFLAYQGRASLGLMIVAGCVGAIVGDSIGYEIGRHLGPRLQSGRLGRRIGGVRWARAAAYLRDRGGRAVFFGRFIGVLRALVPAVAGSAAMPYRTFFPFNVAGGVLWASAFIVLGYVTGGSWRVVERWAGRASLVLLLLLALAAMIALGTRWARDHATELSQHWRALLMHPRVARLRRRYQTQLDFVARRVDPRSALGLRLTFSLLFVLAGAWAFGALLEDVLSNNELALVDRPSLEFMATHRSSVVTDLMIGLSWLGDPLVAGAGLVLLLLLTSLRKRLRRLAAPIALATLGIGLPYLVAFLVNRSGPPGALVPQPASSFPSVFVTAAVLVLLGGALVLSSGRRWATRVWIFGAAVFLASSVGFARVYLEADWVTDAVAGLALGVAWFAICHSMAIPIDQHK